MRGCSDSPYWQETVAPLPTENTSASSEVEKTNEIPVTTVEEEERDDEVAVDKQDITRAEIPEAKDQGPRHYPQRVHRLKPRPQALFLLKLAGTKFVSPPR